jgi:hypothetical protein
MANKQEIKYINKDFNSLKNDLITYAKSYYPTVYNDFSQASPGSMFIEMAAYIGDVLSFYLDNQIQETFLQYAKQPNNLYTLAYMMGYRPKVISAATVNLDIYQQVPFKVSGSQRIPDFDYALTIAEGMQVQSSANSSIYFYTTDKVNFSVSSSTDPTEISVYTVDANNNPTNFLLKKSANAISGQLKQHTLSFGSAQRFPSVVINDANIVSIISAVDSNGNNWYEVPYLAQDYILQPVANTSSTAYQVPYFIQKTYTQRRYVTRFKSDDTLEIEFGPGMNTVADTALLPNPNTVSVGLTNGGLSQLNTAFDPTNFVTTQTYGLAPTNVNITFNYLVGGGAQSNVLANQLTIPKSFTFTGINTSRSNTVAINNPEPASGGGDGDTIDELRQNSMAEFQTQYRAVTPQDYMARSLSMPGIYGKISKAFVTKNDVTFGNYLNSNKTQIDNFEITIYILGLDANGNLSSPTPALLKNLQSYLLDYRMMTDSISLKPAYIINIGINFDIAIRPNYIGQDVISRCISELQSYFDKDNWQINQPIILSNVYSLLDSIEGVQTVKNIEIVNKSGTQNGYSQYNYDIASATVNNVVYPSLDPSIFSVQFPNSDIQGRVVTIS